MFDAMELVRLEAIGGSQVVCAMTLFSATRTAFEFASAYDKRESNRQHLCLAGCGGHAGARGHHRRRPAQSD